MTDRIEVQIAERIPFADGHAFGDVGAYERLSGRMHFAVDPHADAQRDVVDLDKAPVDDGGLVRFAADFMILKPRDMQRGNRRVFYDYGNRGHKRALQFYNDAPHSNAPMTLTHAGNGFFMRRGYAVAWLAWEGDMLPGDGRMVLDVPVASDKGKAITGRIRVEYIADVPGITCFPLSGRIAAHSYAAVSLDTRDAVLARRRYPYDTPEVIPHDQWRFASAEAGIGGETQSVERAVVPSERHIFLPAGFQPGWIYELVYTAKDPLVHGLGHVAVRDFISFLKYDRSDANPLRGIEKAYAWGRSQTGRCLRDFVYRGFNADAQGRRVFDGVFPHVAGAGRKWLNHRFASPIVSGGQQYEDHFNIADSFPFSYAWSTDHLTGKQDAILKRPDTDSLVMHTQTATEYRVRRGSLAHTDTQGNDLKQPDTVRVYCWSSSQHFADPQPKAPSRGHGQNLKQTYAAHKKRHAHDDEDVNRRRAAVAGKPFHGRVERCHGPIAEEQIAEDGQPYEHRREQPVPDDQRSLIRPCDARGGDRGRRQGCEHESLRAADAEQQPNDRGRDDVDTLQPFERGLRAAVRPPARCLWTAMNHCGV